MMKILIFSLIFSINIKAQQIDSLHGEITDLREYQHGIDIVEINDTKKLLIYSSTGNPPIGVGDDNIWPHDVFSIEIDINNIPTNLQNNAQIVIDNFRAQEPASSAINSDGHIMISMEDAALEETGGTLAQSYGVYTYSNQLLPLTVNSVDKGYPRWLFNDDGSTMGHSGHIASSGTNFVIFYSEEWIDGGGVDDLGSGDDVYANIYDTNGDIVALRLEIAVGDATRDWWPMIAASQNTSLLLWQRFVDGQEYSTLKYSIINSQTGTLIKNTINLEENVKYYTYSIEYLKKLDRYLIVGTHVNNTGFAYLLDNQGNIVTQEINLIPIRRQAQLISNNKNTNNNTVVYASYPTGLTVLNISPTSINTQSQLTDNYQWQSMGVDGFFIDDYTAYLVALSDVGLVSKTFTIPDIIYHDGFE